jgi:protein-tyrosine phosphatase
MVDFQLLIRIKNKLLKKKTMKLYKTFLMLFCFIVFILDAQNKEEKLIIKNNSIQKDGMFRSVIFSGKIKGSLYFHSMPGRYEPLNASISEIKNKKINIVVSLTSLDEIREKAPEFANAIEKDSLQFERIEFPIIDFGVPKNTEAFLKLAKYLAEQLESGKKILIHCGAGIGRTGILAASILINMDINLQKTLEMIEKAGSKPETKEQLKLVERIAEQLEEE